MKTDIYKIKTDQAWNRLYNRLDNDRLLAKVDEGHHMRKLSPWMRHGAVAAVLIGIVCGALYWVSGFKEPVPDLLRKIRVPLYWQPPLKTVPLCFWAEKLRYCIRNILLRINGK